jgi:succinoglycan biosynthesis transport protein ExoP
MLNRVEGFAGALRKTSAEDEARRGFGLSDALAMARRQWSLIAITVAAALLIALWYLQITPPIFLANSYLMLDSRKLQLFNNQSVISEVGIDAPYIDSQLEVLRSDSVASSVVQELKLAQDPEFTVGAPSWLSSIKTTLLAAVAGDGDNSKGQNQLPEVLRAKVAAGVIRSNLQVQRVRFTYIIQIGFTALDPQKAVSVANAVADRYIFDQAQSKQETTTRAVAWLRERTEDLRRQAVEAEREVQEFRTKYNIIQSGGRSIDEQLLADLNSQVFAARSETSDARARLDRLQDAIKSGVPSATTTAALQNEVLNRLRNQSVDIAKRYSDFLARYGNDHFAVVNLQKEMKQIERAMLDELRRMAQRYASDLEIAQTKERTTEAALKELTQRNAGARESQGALQVLESAAQAHRTMHESYLRRYMEATQQESVANTEARIITPASGAAQVSPQPTRVFSTALLLGLFAGAGLAFGRERLNRALRTTKEVEKALGVECLGILPEIPVPTDTHTTGVKERAPGKREIAHNLGIGRQVVLTPFSRFAETVRAIKVAADTATTANDVRVIGIVSALPGEGKTTIASNLAHAIAHGGSATLLIDGDLRSPALTKLTAPGAEIGIMEVLEGTCSVDEVLWKDPVTGLDFLPGLVGYRISDTPEVLASSRMSNLLASARERYDYIIVDFPPIAPAVDAKAAAHLVDAFMLVIGWGRTSPEIISDALASADTVSVKLLGAVLNHADPSELKRVEAYKDAYYTQYGP